MFYLKKVYVCVREFWKYFRETSLLHFGIQRKFQNSVFMGFLSKIATINRGSLRGCIQFVHNNALKNTIDYKNQKIRKRLKTSFLRYTVSKNLGNVSNDLKFLNTSSVFVNYRSQEFLKTHTYKVLFLTKTVLICVINFIH